MYLLRMLIVTALVVAPLFGETARAGFLVTEIEKSEKQAEKPAPEIVSTGKRLALVIGVGDYLNVSPIPNSVADANAIGAKLTENGFDVTLLVEPTLARMSETLAAFSREAAKGRDAVVYFSGNGVSLDGEDFLLPKDIPGLSVGGAAAIKAGGVRLSTLMADLKQPGGGARVVIIDACRDDPFAAAAAGTAHRSPRPKPGEVVVAAIGQAKRSEDGSRGPAASADSRGAFLMFSTGAGQQALDRLSGADHDPNSLFARKLLPLMSVKGLEIRTLALKVRREVRDAAKSAANFDQAPAVYDDLVDEFYFAP